MSTPRTDAAAKEVRSTENGILVRADFARELERENAELNETTRKLNETTKKHVAAYYELLAENANLRDSQCTTWHLEKLLAENTALRSKLEDPARLHAHCVRYLTNAQVSHLFGERMTEIQNDRDRLEAENAALREDKARLDWLLTYEGRTWFCQKLDSGEWIESMGDVRGFIDSAMVDRKL